MNIHEKITQKIIEQLESGVIPWRKPWKNIAGINFQNPVSGTVYSGMNVFLLSIFSRHRSPKFVTFKQAKEAGGSVRKGEKGYPITFFKFITKEDGKWVDVQDPEENPDKLPVIRGYTVFNIEQCEGLPEEWYDEPEVELNDIQKIDRAEAIAEGYQDGPEVIEELSNRAFYRPATDTVHMPDRGQFDSAEAYYHVLFHELGHSTGHATRLSRDGVTDSMRDSTQYGEEELIAELTSAYLSGSAGFDQETIPEQASYIDNWLKALRSPRNAKLVTTAATAASKAARWIEGDRPAKSKVA